MAVADPFPDDLANALQPALSVNYVTSHDGSTLYDLTAYNHKRNWANGEENRDGFLPIIVGIRAGKATTTSRWK